MYPVSGLYDGFFSPFAAHFWRMGTQGGGLYVGTNDWAYLLQENKQYAWLQETVLAGVLGFNLWATCDGDDWFNITRDAFDGDEYNFGGRSIVNGGAHDEDLFIGTANQAQGTTVYDDQGEACSGLVNSNRRAAVSRPGALMTYSLRHGNLLTWERSANATSYEVEQAPYVNITVGLKAPMTLPNGWQMEDATPTVTAPGAAGANTVTLSVPGAFQPVGSTASPDFVTHSTGKFVYEVVAKSATGRKSDPSNVVVAPFGGAPATFASLKSAITSSTPTANLAGKQARIELARANTRLDQILDAAQTAAASGRDRAARRDVAELQADAADNDELAAIAARVQRRLHYVNIAGAP
jgi:hypothetical protein